ncbi:natural resistance-associated macrophage protein-domain-containing protein [Triangularia verruculosa]|uniref:Natural resistance-associated macrophage protein-domain-containing protein n=1 Tax=Triangularia verruculosa TaxID=2587418 RepID=A0AAN6X744_9PEZI|nr:natural resistance-associated macrophage protein-domain-containing protein [Triangularia verruculosa]
MATPGIPDPGADSSPATSTPAIESNPGAKTDNSTSHSSPNPEGDALPLIRSLHQRASVAPRLPNTTTTPKEKWTKIKKAVITFGKFIGPGFMVAVAYIDPGNYATDISAGASYQFRLLFVVLLSNIFAIFLQTLSIKLGTVSGLNLAEACREFLPRWLNYVLYVLAEGAIIATDVAEVIGTAIAINLLVPQIPLVAGCGLSILEVMLILVFYGNGGVRGLRMFEYFVMGLVMAVVGCFCVQLSMIEAEVGEVFRGYLPGNRLVEGRAMYQACGILGATVMPHSLYLGSGIVQARLYEFDAGRGLLPEGERQEEEDNGMKGYRPSLDAIRHSMKYSVAELAVALFSFALFVNSAILIVAGAALYGRPEAEGADLFGIHELLSKSIAPVAGTVFALALLFSGVSAGIVCTIAGQMVSEGALRWRVRPWVRRLVTRGVSIVPSIVIAAAVGREGLDQALNGSQVALSVVLPFITAPLIYFTGVDRYMTVRPGMARFGGHFGGEGDEETVGGEGGRGNGGEEGVKGSVDLDLEHGSGSEFAGCGRGAGVGPAVGGDFIGDELEGVELFGGVGDGGGVPEEDGGAVVVAVGEGGEGEDEAVDGGGGDGYGEAWGGVGGAGGVYEAGGDVTVEVEV